jgi:hypothetical protein
MIKDAIGQICNQIVSADVVFLNDEGEPLMTVSMGRVVSGEWLSQKVPTADDF